MVLPFKLFSKYKLLTCFPSKIPAFLPARGCFSFCCLPSHLWTLCNFWICPAVDGWQLQFLKWENYWISIEEIHFLRGHTGFRVFIGCPGCTCESQMLQRRGFLISTTLHPAPSYLLVVRSLPGWSPALRLAGHWTSSNTSVLALLVVVALVLNEHNCVTEKLSLLWGQRRSLLLPASSSGLGIIYNNVTNYILALWGILNSYHPGTSILLEGVLCLSWPLAGSQLGLHLEEPAPQGTLQASLNSDLL